VQQIGKFISERERIVDPVNQGIFDQNPAMRVISVFLAGLGEKIDDLQLFNRDSFISGIFD